MYRRNHFAITFVFIAMLTFACSSSEKDETKVVGSSDYTDLISLFKEFREFEKPKVTNGVPDYTAVAMEEQRRGVKKFQSSLDAIDISTWPVSQQVDYHLVRAEMNALDFYHRVLHPWSRNPGFYLISQAPKGPTIYRKWRIPRRLPLPAEDISEFRMKLQAVPEILKQARENLTEGSGDLALIAIWAMEPDGFMDNEYAIFRDLATRLAEHHQDLVPDAERALAAVDDYREWLMKNKSKMTAPAGVGKENYNWWLKNVELFPYTWEECLVIAQREYERAIAFLKLEENRNRKLPQLELAANEAEHRRRWNENEQYILKFLREEKILTVPEYLVPSGPRPWATIPERTGGAREFFQQCEDRDSLPNQCHNFLGHNLDDLKGRRDNRAIRGAQWNHFYRIDHIRSEGFATFMEEMLMHVGMLDKRRRGREILYIMLAHRAARALADLKMNSTEFTLRDAIQHVVELTPYGWCEDGHEIRHDMEMALRNPGYTMGYLVGKVHLEKLLADRAMQLGDKFNLRQFIDEFLAAGMIPLSLIRWEMTGNRDEIRKLSGND